MFDGQLDKIEIAGTEYPYKCDMVVLEKIQQQFGDILEFEHAIMGVVPFYDENGVRDEKKDRYTIPDIGKVCSSLVWMIEEGIEISGADMKAPEIKEIMRQEDYSASELALVVYKEFSKSFLSKRSGKKAKDTVKN